MVNIEFLVIASSVGLIVDWLFQFDWQARNKSKWSFDDNWKKSALALISHSFIYASITTFITFCLMQFTRENDTTLFFIPTALKTGAPLIIDNLEVYLKARSDAFMIFMTLFITHAIIDTRIPVKLVMLMKHMTKEQINDYQNYGFMHIGIDHRLHELVILILSTKV